MKYIDIHSHILPFVDDGSSDMWTTLKMLKLSEEEGIASIIATPHYRSGMKRKSISEIKEILEEVQEKIEKEGLQIKIYLGNEVLFGEGIIEKIKKGEILTLNESDRVLIEFYPNEEYQYINDFTENLLYEGFIPVIAHIERYQCLYRNQDYVKKLKENGCEIQVNAGSITGPFYSESRSFVNTLLKKKYVDYIGTDAHDLKNRRPLIKKSADFLYKKYGREYAEKILFKNAGRNLIKLEI